MDSMQEELVSLTQDLLVAIGAKDWDRYCELCDPSLSAFEPEAVGHLIDGLDFHRYYFDLESSEEGPMQSTVVAPHVRVMGDVAVVAYIRLTQRLVAGRPVTVCMEETRVWQRQRLGWRHVHFHRSKPTAS